MRRVVVTGLGMVSPLACGVEETWKRLIAGENAAKTITVHVPDCRLLLRDCACLDNPWILVIPECVISPTLTT